MKVLFSILKWAFIIAAAVVIVPIMFCVELSKRY